MGDEHNTRASLFRVVRGVPALKEALVAGRRRVALTGTAPTAAQPASPLEARFRQRCAELDAPSVLELGTKQSVPGRSTMHRDVVPHARKFLGTDVDEGADVDVVAMCTACPTNWAASAST
jgi:hypothetical protein